MSRRLFSGAAWNSAAVGVAQASVFVTNIILANILGQNTFGQFSLITTTVNALVGSSQLAMGYTATKFIAEYRSKDKVAVAHAIRLCARVASIAAWGVAAVLVIGAGPLAGAAFGAPELRAPLLWAAVAVMAAVFAAVPTGVLIGFEAFRRLAGVGIAQATVHFFAIAGLALLYGVTGAVAGLAVTSGVRLLLARRGATRTLAINDVPMVDSAVSRALQQRVIFGFAVPAALSGLTALPSLWLSTTFLARQDGGFSEVALFSVALALKNLVIFVPGLVNGAAMSILNNQLGIGNFVAFHQTFWTNLRVNTVLVLLVAGGIVLTSNWVLGWYGPGFIAARTALTILMLAAVLEGIGACLYQLVQSHARMWQSFLLIALPRDLLMLGLAYHFVPERGAEGLALAYLLSWGGAAIVTGLLVRAIEPRLFRRVPT